MCSGCSGNYEGDSEDSGPPSARGGDKIGGDRFGRDKSIRTAASQTRTRGYGHDTRNQGLACEYQARSEYEVLVSADEIIEIHRIHWQFRRFVVTWVGKMAGEMKRQRPVCSRPLSNRECQNIMGLQTSG